MLSGTPGVPSSTYQAAKNQSGELYVEADIHPPGAPSFRESVQLAQDEIPGIGMGFNYGSEPMEAREAKACPDCLGEETWLSSWPYGDPALVKLASGLGPWLPPTTGERRSPRTAGWPSPATSPTSCTPTPGTRRRSASAWRGSRRPTSSTSTRTSGWQTPEATRVTGEGPDAKPESSTIDSQSFGPGEAFSAELLYGAGSRNGTFGDSIFHCHLYPHFAEGFWAIMRVHDVRLDGTTATPDGIAVRPLIPLPGRRELRPSPRRTTRATPA